MEWYAPAKERTKMNGEGLFGIGAMNADKWEGNEYGRYFGKMVRRRRRDREGCMKGKAVHLHH